MEERQEPGIQEFERVKVRYHNAVSSVQSHEWAEIRKDDYWEVRDGLPNQYQKMLFTIFKIEQYVKRK